MSAEPNWKPAKGTAWIAMKGRKRERKSVEDKTMLAAKRRDSHTCRFPNCEYMRMDPRVEAAHRRHRGMGGNPAGDRTTLNDLVTWCFIHHSEWDRGGEWDIEPQQAERGFSGPCDFYRTNPANGKWEIFARETVIGVSVAVGN
jgi:hypothetical protein